MSAEELDVVRQAHSLSESINISVLSDEGAANLLNAPGHTQDLNNDGLKVGVLPNLGTTVWIIDPLDLKEELENELKQYE